MNWYAVVKVFEVDGAKLKIRFRRTSWPANLHIANPDYEADQPILYFMNGTKISKHIFHAINEEIEANDWEGSIYE